MSGSYEYGGQAEGSAPPLAPGEVPTAVSDTAVFPILTMLASCLCEQVEATIGGLPCFCGVVPGRFLPMDFCDCFGSGCGMAFVRLDSVVPSVAFPNASPTPSCSDPLAVRIEVGVHRCLPGMNEAGEPPDVAAQDEAVAIQMADMMAIRRAIKCCWQSSSKDYLLGPYTPSGPDGNCGGGSWIVTARVW